MRYLDLFSVNMIFCFKYIQTGFCNLGVDEIRQKSGGDARKQNSLIIILTLPMNYYNF